MRLVHKAAGLERENRVGMSIKCDGGAYSMGYNSRSLNGAQGWGKTAAHGNSLAVRGAREDLHAHCAAQRPRAARGGQRAQHREAEPLLLAGPGASVDLAPRQLALWLRCNLSSAEIRGLPHSF